MTALTGEIALVTGASRGIGRAIAAELMRRGARVVGTATSQTGADSISAELSKLSADGEYGAGAGEGVGEVVNVTDSEQVKNLLAQVSDRYGPPSILVNNAGITRDGLLARLTEDDWDSVIDTNLKAVYRLSRAVLRTMLKARHGRIINITSVVGSQGNAGQTNYAASKAGVIGFTLSLAREIGARNVTVNAVAPGFIDTDMTRALNEQQRTGILAGIPLNRLGEAREVAAAVAFLASADGAYITGHTLHVNGGMYMG